MTDASKVLQHYDSSGLRQRIEAALAAAGLSVGVPPDTIAPQAPHLKLLGAGPFPCLSNTTTTERGH